MLGKIIIATISIYLFTSECHASDYDGYKYLKQYQAYYKHFYTILNFDDAVAACIKNDAKLYLPKSETEQNDVMSALSTNHIYLWYAITDRKEEGKFVPIDESRKNNYFIKWMEGEPNDAEHNEDCVAFNGYEVYDCPCSFKFGFICVKLFPPGRNDEATLHHPSITPTPTRSTEAVSIPTYYRYVPELKKSYKLYLRPKKWDDALIACTDDGANLSVIDNDDEAVYLKELLKLTSRIGHKNINHSFLGFHDKKEKGKFVTVTGRRFNSNLKWKNNRKIGGANENCGTFNSNGDLVVTSCDTPKEFICEIPSMDYFITQDNVKQCGTSEAYVEHPELNIFYKMNNSLQTWNNARKICRTENATLAMPKNKAEAEEILNIFHKTINEKNIKNIHLGFHDLFTEGEYLTENGDSIQFYYHETDKFRFNKSITSGNCGSLNRDGKLDHISCSKTAPFICQIRTLPYRLNNIPRTCISDIDYVFGYDFEHGYKLHLNPRTWGIARLICASEGGNLAVINSVKEKDFLLELFKKSQNSILRPVDYPDNVLLGFHDLFEEGHHTTVTGESLDKSGYFIWKTDGMRNLEENCGSMTSDGLLDDFPCFVPAAFFCEISNWDY